MLSSNVRSVRPVSFCVTGEFSIAQHQTFRILRELVSHSPLLLNPFEALRDGKEWTEPVAWVAEGAHARTGGIEEHFNLITLHTLDDGTGHAYRLVVG